MSHHRRRGRAITLAPAILAAVTASLSAEARGDAGQVSFDRDVRPILSEHCYRCHGPDPEKRKAGLRLDRREEAIVPLKSGSIALVPGDPRASELYLRVVEDDETLRMPPAKSAGRLTAAQVETLRRWIAEGAVWEEHWSQMPPQRPRVPDVHGHAWVRNEIDRFLLRSMEERRIAPSPEADRVTLIRRLTST